MLQLPNYSSNIIVAKGNALGMVSKVVNRGNPHRSINNKNIY